MRVFFSWMMAAVSAGLIGTGSAQAQDSWRSLSAPASLSLGSHRPAEDATPFGAETVSFRSLGGHTFSDCDACDSFGCDSFCGKGGGVAGLLGRIRPSDHCFDDFISPMINFVYFEDPRTLTELRPIFVHHRLPSTVGTGPLAAGGSVQLYAPQFRIALTERLSLIAVKAGFIVDNIGEGPVDALIGDGWADVTVGLKYNLLRDAVNGTLWSVGGSYELPVGTPRAQQAIGDGEFHLFTSFAQRFWNGDAHYMTGFGYRLPVDGNLQSEALHWSNHFDVRLTDRVYLFSELAWWHWTDAANNGLPLGVAGQDLFNLPASDIAGNNLVTQNVGLKFKPNRNIEAGIAYEFPLTNFKDVIRDRLQVEFILRY